MIRSAWSLPLLLLLAACPSDDAGETADDGGSTAEGGQAACEPPLDQTSDCCCFTSHPDAGYIENTCSSVALCPGVAITCSNDDPECPAAELIGAAMGSADVFEVNDEAALDCVLQALRDGTPGTLEWGFLDFTYGGQFRRSVTQHLAEGRVVFTAGEDVLDQSGVVYDVTEETLLPPEHFEECLQGDVRAKSLCLVATTTGTVAATCAMGGNYDNF